MRILLGLLCSVILLAWCEISGTPQLKLEEPGTFWVAESNHPDFYKTNPAHYNRYRTGCGRDRRIKAIWKDVK